MWELQRGAIPSGLCVLHHCDNRRCVNPAHLFLGTNTDNMQYKTRKGRGRNSSCEKNSNAVLSDADVKEIRDRCRTPLCGKILSRRLKTSPDRLSR